MAKCQTCGGSHLSSHEMCPNVTASDQKFWSSAEGKRFLREQRVKSQEIVAKHFGLKG